MNRSFFERIKFYVQRRSHNIGLRNFWCFLLRFTLPESKIHSASNFLNTQKSEKEIFNDLKDSGFSDLGLVISDAEITTIARKLEALNCYDTDKRECVVVDLKSPSADTQLAHYKREDISNISEILAIANDSKILNAVSEYFGCQPTISNINCWWSFGDRACAKEAQFFHRDLDDFRFLKMFVYLTDVSIDNGPHIFIKHSHTSNKLNKLRRFSDEEVYQIFDQSNVLILAKSKGNCFIEDTYGIHKGQLPKAGKRLLLQVQYSYLPLHVEDYQPNKTAKNHLTLDKYINRLIIQ